MQAHQALARYVIEKLGRFVEKLSVVFERRRGWVQDFLGKPFGQRIGALASRLRVIAIRVRLRGLHVPPRANLHSSVIII